MTRTISALGIGVLLTLASTSPAWSDSHRGSLKKLCTYAGCVPVPEIVKVPRIETVFGFIRPDGMVLVGGTGLERSVRIIFPALSSTPPWVPNVEWRKSVKGYYLNLDIEYRSSTLVMGKIPNVFSGITDQQVLLQATGPSGLHSNVWPLQFRARREIRELHRTDPAVKLVSCGDDSNYDNCNGVVDDGEVSNHGTLCLGTLCGIHENVWAAIGDDKGTDKYKIGGLKNGWYIEDFIISRHRTSSAEVIKDPKPWPPDEPATWRPQIFWKVTPNDRLAYTVTVYIEGPKGVPHN